jgi:hypothetical protein
MPAISTAEATEKLARGVEGAKVSHLAEIFSELFPEDAVPDSLIADDIVRHIRDGLAAEEIVDLWNVVFPEDRHVWYDEQEQAIRYNEEMAGYSD